MAGSPGCAPELRAAVDDLYARYFWALDTADTDAYVACFTRDAVVLETMPDGSLHRGQGHGDVRRFVVDGFHSRPEWAGHQHHVGNVVIDPDPEGRPDRLHVRAYCFSTVTRQDLDATDGWTGVEAARVTWAGWSEDDLALEDGRWRFAERAIRPWTGDVLARFGAPAGSAG